jgi:glycosyltransferase involved in cell wall biosynthesis
VPTDGGSYTYLTSVIDELKNTTVSGHTFEFAHFHLFHQRARNLPPHDFVWFLAPNWFEVREPFAITVWDLGHRALPYFPEVSVSGWKWDDRESFYARVLPKAALISVGNDILKDQIQYAYRIGSERFLWNPLPVENGLKDYPPLLEDVVQLEGSGKYLLYPAQLWPHKNHVTVIDAIKILNDAGHDFHLVCTGADKGNLSYLCDYAREKRVVSRVHFLGFVSRLQLVALYRKAYCLVFASLLGPDNLPPIEAMALGCPVVCSDYPGATDQLLGAALIFDALNAEELAGSIRAVERKRATLVAKGHEVANAYSVKNYAGRIVAALDEFAKVRRLWGTGYEERQK